MQRKGKIFIVILVIAGVALLWNRLRPSILAHKTSIRVLCLETSRTMPFHIASDQGLFDAERLNVRLAQMQRGTGGNVPSWEQVLNRVSEEEAQVAAACPARVIVRALIEAPGEWRWFGAGFETVDGCPLSLLYIKRQVPIKQVSDLEGLLTTGKSVIAVPDEVWAQECQQLWQFPDDVEPVVLKPFSADRFAEHDTTAVFGDAETLLLLEDDPRFIRLGVNLRARQFGIPYWDSAHLVRQEFVDTSPEAVSALSDAIEQSQQYLEANSVRGTPENMTILFGQGKIRSVPSYLLLDRPLTDFAIPVVKGTNKIGELAEHSRLMAHGMSQRRKWQSENGILSENSDDSVPPFGPPKGKDVLTSSEQ